MIKSILFAVSDNSHIVYTRFRRHVGVVLVGVFFVMAFIYSALKGGLR